MNDHELPQPQTSNRHLVSSALMVVAATLLGAFALTAFCFAWGLNFKDEGWTHTDGTAVPIDRAWMFTATASSVVATILFWVGLVRLTRQSQKPTRPE